MTELVIGSGRNPDSRAQYRINAGDPDRTLAIEDDLLILTDIGGVVLMVKQKGGIVAWLPNSCRQCLPLIDL